VERHDERLELGVGAVLGRVQVVEAVGHVLLVGEVGLRKPRPRPAMLTTFGQRMASDSWRNLR
jgi:hypothetical protein